jgi:hypothetical protein
LARGLQTPNNSAKPTPRLRLGAAYLVAVRWLPYSLTAIHQLAFIAPMTLTIDHQDATEPCGHCGADYAVTRGSVYHDERPVALYIAAMHGCAAMKNAVMAVAFPPSDGKAPIAASLQVWVTPNEIQMSVVEPEQSPWNSHVYLGRHLTRDQVLASPYKERLFEVADAVVALNVAPRSYLEVDGAAEGAT